MLIQLLEFFRENKSYSLQELSELTNKDINTLKFEMEYLENNGYIKKQHVTTSESCTANCKYCLNCIADNGYIWVLENDCNKDTIEKDI